VWGLPDWSYLFEATRLGLHVWGLPVWGANPWGVGHGKIKSKKDFKKPLTRDGRRGII